MEHLLQDDGRASRFVKFIIANPWKFLVGTLIFSAMMFLPMKYIVADFSYRTWFRESDPLLTEFDSFERRYGNDDAIVLALHSPSGIFDKDSLETLRQMTADMWKVHDVIRVDSLSNFNWVHGKGDAILVEPLLDPEDGNITDKFMQERKAVAEKDETVPGYLMGRDAKTAVLFARIKPAIVNYGKAIIEFMERGKIDEEDSYYTTFMRKYGARVVADDELLADDPESGKEHTGDTAVFEKIREKRNGYLRGIVAKIQEKEKSQKLLLDFHQAMDVLKAQPRPDYSDELKKIKPEASAELEKLGDRDYKELLRLVALHEKNKSPDYQKIVAQTKEVVKKYNGKSDHTVLMNGGVYLSDSFRESTITDMSNMVPLAIGMIVIFLIVTFRRIGGVLLTLTIIALTDISVIGSMGLFGFRFNNMTSIVPQIMIAIGIADAVHILTTYYQFLARGASKMDAVFLSLRKNLIPTILTSVTTCAGFISFGTSKVDPIASMGLLSAIGTAYAWFFTYTFLGPLMVLLPIKIKEHHAKEQDIVSLTPFSIKAADFLFKNRWVIIVVFSVTTLLAIVASINHRINSDPFSYFKKGTPLRQSLEFMEKNIGGAMGIELNIDSGKPEGIKDPEFLAKVEKLQNWIIAQKKDGHTFVTKTVSIIDILKAMNRTLNGGNQDSYQIPSTREVTAEQLFLYTMNLPVGMDINDRMTIANDAMRMTVLWTLHDANTVLGEVAAIKKQAAEIGLNISITGKQVLFPSLNPYVVNSFIISIIMAVVMVSIILMVGFKSVKLGALAMIPNAIPLFIGSGAIWLAGKDLDMGIVIVFSICLGIAVDDTIHFLENFRKELKQGKDGKTAVATVFTFTGPALVTTTLILVASFGTFTLATFVPNINFGLFTALILSAALIADIVFLPSLVMALEKWLKK